MRKAQKQEILEILNNFPEMHKEIRTAIMQDNVSVALQLLQDCQEYAINLCQTIVALEGQETVAVEAFEEYCLALVDVAEALEKLGTDAANRTDSDIKCTDENAVSLGNVGSLIERLDKNSNDIAGDIRENIPARKEVVFFPYKASMWDSLESIYLAAREDEECDAYCVPIPYFDKNPDGSFKEMHYEGAEYPANIEVIDWQTYNFEERRPDAIYIHNPYDNGNYVTSVHPRFYAENLRKYTEELVYVPYFVLEEIEPHDQNKINQMKHFCVVPGTVYAHKVILQSEKMAQIYINEYVKAVEAAGGTADREQLKQKFLGLGSPKFDKVQNTKKEELDIPAEWLKIIEKPDGSWKKIIFYNTSITALLEHDERMLEKMEYVFKVFEERQDEVALLWRPHPLIPSTIESMRPQLWEKYKEIVDKYKAEGWGIYDDTADMDRAVVLSDAYYGDQSSIVQLYQKTGKKVLIQDVQIVQSNGLGNVRTSIGVEVDNVFWAAVSNFNGIVKIHTNGQIEYVCAFPGYKLWETHLFGKVISFERELYFLPQVSSQLAVYYLDSKKIEYIDLGKSNVQNIHRYADICIWKKELFLFPKCSEEIVKLNLDSYKVEKISAPIKYLKDNELLYNGIAFMEYNINVKQNIATLFCYCGKTVIKFDMDTLEFGITNLNGVTGNFVSALQDEKCMYICGDEQVSIRSLCDNNLEWSIETECEKEFFAYLDLKESIIFFPFRGNDLLILDKESRESKRISIDFDRRVFRNKEGVRVSAPMQIGDDVYFCTREGNDVFACDIRERCMKKDFSLCKSDEEKCIADMYEDMMNWNKDISEKEMSLKLFLYIISTYL